jgi:hypothetical protein
MSLIERGMICDIIFNIDSDSLWLNLKKLKDIVYEDREFMNIEKLYFMKI